MQVLLSGKPPAGHQCDCHLQCLQLHSPAGGVLHTANVVYRRTLAQGGQAVLQVLLSGTQPVGFHFPALSILQ